MLVSVIMPSFNSEKYIKTAIDSVINQTISDWELLIVDDCSTDNTVEIIKKYEKEASNIHLYQLDKNGGPAVARNKGIENAKGKYIAFLDSDDIWLPEKLELQINYMEKNRIYFSCTGYGVIKEDGQITDRIVMPPKKSNYEKTIILGNPIGNLTAVYNQEVLGKVFVPLIKKRNDFALWLQILKKTQYCYGMQKVLAFYRTGRNDSVSRKKIELIKYHWELYRSIEKHGIVRSCLETMSCIVVKLILKIKG